MADNNETSLDIGISALLDAGLHFGHQSKRWNPQMKRFIFGKRQGIYIIDLTKTQAQLKLAQQFIYATVASGRQILFIGTKRACQETLKEAATRCGQHYVISRWLGGTLTNHRHISNSIRRMREIEALDQQGTLAKMPQKEASRLRHELSRLQRNLSGIADMQEMPGAIIAIDINREAIAIKEANRMHIPVVALVDTNCDPNVIQYPIPGNDDATRGIKLVIDVLVDAITRASAQYSVALAKRKEIEEAAEKNKVTAGSDLQKPKREGRPRRRSVTRSKEKSAAATETAKPAVAEKAKPVVAATAKSTVVKAPAASESVSSETPPVEQTPAED